MNDFDFDAMQKKRIASGARHKRNGSKSRMCSLPSDNLTAAQQKKLNGECKSWNLNEPMDWETFKAMPHDLQVQYVKGLHSRFSVGYNQLGRDLFRLSTNAVRNYFRQNGVTCTIVAGRISRAEQEVWEHWIHGGEYFDAEVSEELSIPELEVVQEEQPEEQPEPKREPTSFEMATFTVEWQGEFSGKAFIEQLSRLPLPTGRVKIHLEVVKE